MREEWKSQIKGARGRIVRGCCPCTSDQGQSRALLSKCCEEGEGVTDAIFDCYCDSGRHPCMSDPLCLAHGSAAHLTLH